MNKRVIRAISIIIAIAIIWQEAGLLLADSADYLRPRPVDERMERGAPANARVTNNAQQIAADDERLAGLAQKKYEGLAPEDFDAANRSASNVVFKLSIDNGYKERVGGLQLEEWLEHHTILDAPEDKLIAVAHLVKDAGGELKDNFCRALNIAYHAINNQRQKSHFKPDRQAYSERCRVISRVLLVFEADNPRLVGDQALDLAHLGKYPEAEEILMRIKGEGRDVRSNTVSLGYVRMELGRGLARTLLFPALKERRFSEALSAMGEVKKLLGGAENELLNVANPYIQGRDDNLTQVPRALSGLVIVDTLYVQMYVQMYLAMGQTPEETQPMDFALRLLGRLSSALNYIRITLQIQGHDERAMRHAEGMMKGALIQAEETLKILSGKEWRPLSLEEAGRRIDEMIRSLGSIQKPLETGILNENVARTLAAAHQARQRIGLYEDVADSFREGVFSYARLGKVDVADPIEGCKARVRQVIIELIGNEYPVEQINGCLETLFTALQYDVIDIDIIYVYRTLKPRERTAEAIAEFIEGTNPQDITRRFRQAKYRFLGFSLVSKDISKELHGPPDTTETKKGDLDRTSYDDKLLIQLIAGWDLKQLTPLEIRYQRIRPWLTDKEQVDFETQIQDIRNGIDAVIRESRFILGLSSLAGETKNTAGVKMSSRERKRATKTARPSRTEIDGAREIIIRRRSGEDKKSGYKAELAKLKGRLENRQADVERQINRGAGVIAGYVVEARELWQRFHIRWLETIIEDLVHLREATVALARDRDSEDYLSRARFEELQEEALGVLGRTEVFEKYRKELTELQEGISKSEQMAKDFPAIEEGTVILKLRRDINRHLEEIQGKFQDIVFEGDFGTQCNTLRQAIGTFQERVRILTDLATRSVHLMEMISEVGEVIGICSTSDASVNDRLIAVMERLDKAISLPLTYDEYERCARALGDAEEGMSEELNELERIARAAHKEKRQRLLEGIGHVNEILKEIENWVNIQLQEDRYRGSSDAAKQATEYFRRFNSLMKRADNLLKSDRIDLTAARKCVSGLFELELYLGNCFLEGVLMSEIGEVHSKAIRDARKIVVAGIKAQPELKQRAVRMLEKDQQEGHFVSHPIVYISDPYGYPVDIKLDYGSAGLDHVFGIPLSTLGLRSMLTEVDNSLRMAGEELTGSLQRWRDFNGQGPIPLPEILNALTYASIFYVANYELAGDHLPILDARTVLRATYKMAFTKWLLIAPNRLEGPVISQKNAETMPECVGIGYRTPEMESYGWGFLERFLKELPPVDTQQGWTNARNEFLDSFFADYKTRVINAFKINDPDAKKKRVISVFSAEFIRDFFGVLDYALNPTLGDIRTEEENLRLISEAI